MTCWGKGLTANETVKYIEQTENVKIGLATVYRHRHSLTAKEIIDELMREQRRDISLTQTPSVRMKYRHKLLSILLPQQIKHDIKLDAKLEVPQLEGLDAEAFSAAVDNFLEREERALRSTN